MHLQRADAGGIFHPQSHDTEQARSSATLLQGGRGACESFQASPYRRTDAHLTATAARRKPENNRERRCSDTCPPGRCFRPYAWRACPGCDALAPRAASVNSSPTRGQPASPRQRPWCYPAPRRIGTGRRGHTPVSFAIVAVGPAVIPRWLTGNIFPT
jgi:hypothetical protein